MNWDAEVESPATISIVGAGPIGIETALYARFLGYDVLLFDTGRPGRYAKRHNNRSIVAPSELLTTPLGWAALKAQSPEVSSVTGKEQWTGSQFDSKYLTPVAKTDLLYDNVYFNTRVVSIGRLNHRRDDLDDMQERCNDEFYITVDSRDRDVYTARADVVVDCRNTFGSFAGMGPGGVFCNGQRGRNDLLPGYQLLQEFPLDDRFENCNGKKILAMGNGEDTVRFITEFCSKRLDNGTNVIWLVTHGEQTAASELLKSIGANSVDQKPLINIIVGHGIVSIKELQGQHVVKILKDDSSVEIPIDFVVPLVNHGYDDSIVRESLYVETTPGNGRWPILASDDSNLSFVTSEPHYYVMQPVEYWRTSDGLKSAHSQIRQLFALLGARDDLDLYDIVSRQAE